MKVKAGFILLLPFTLWLASCSEGETPKKFIDRAREDIEEAEGMMAEPISVISKGASFDLEKNLVKGKVTVFEFYADW